MKLLIVDDDDRIRDKYSSLAREVGVDVITAASAKEGIEVALSEKPDAVITDKDMERFNAGNDLARDVITKVGVPVVGITGGSPDDFDPKYMKLRLSKSISDNDFRSLVTVMRDNRYDLVNAYAKATGRRFDPFEREVVTGKILGETYSAIDVLVQGYLLCRSVKAGEQPIEGHELPTPTDQAIENLLDTKQCELNFYESLQELRAGIEPALSEYATRGNPDVVTAVRSLLDVDIVDSSGRIVTDNAERFHEAYMKLWEVLE
jgi:CheY-like chemotaxis protein